MKKNAYGSLVYDPLMATKTLADLYTAIRGDIGLTPSEKQKIMGQVQGLTNNAPAGTPLSALMAQGLGGMLGYLISKYFGMGAVGRVASTLMGVGLGRMINDHLNKPPEPFPGYRMLGQ